MAQCESTRLPTMWLGIDSWTRRSMWVEFVVGYLLSSERLFSGFPLFSKINNSKFQFDPDFSGRAFKHGLSLLVLYSAPSGFSPGSPVSTSH